MMSEFVYKVVELVEPLAESVLASTLHGHRAARKRAEIAVDRCAGVSCALCQFSRGPWLRTPQIIQHVQHRLCEQIRKINVRVRLCQRLKHFDTACITRFSNRPFTRSFPAYEVQLFQDTERP